MEGDNSHIDHARRPSIWFTTAFVSFLTVMGVVSVIKVDESSSSIENRTLAPVPHFSTWALFSGSYTDSLELYYADNFPMREMLVSSASTIRDFAGYHSEIVYYRAETVPEAPPVQVDTVSGVKPDSAAIESSPDTTRVAAEFDKAAGVVVYDDRAIQLFTASSDAATEYAEMVNLYMATFDSLEIFCLIAPTSTDFYLPDEYKKSSNYEIKTVRLVRDSLDPAVHFVDAYNELQRRTDEYIFFNTDHHWTGRGAYYAYVAFCKSAGFEPVPMKGFEHKQVKRTFLGSLYGITLDKRLKNNRDSVEYFKPVIPIKTFRYNKDSAKYEFSRLFANTHNYANFIGGDHPMVRIESEVNTNRILVIKDSYGNAVAPFLALHYGTVYVMDYRYFDVNVREFVKQNDISAILFLHNTFAANSKYTAYRGNHILNLKTRTSQQQRGRVDSTTTRQHEQQP